jgi:hypothetical protein
VAGSCEYGDEPSGSGATELVSLVHSATCIKICKFLPIMVAALSGAWDLAIWILRSRVQNLLKLWIRVSSFCVAMSLYVHADPCPSNQQLTPWRQTRRFITVFTKACHQFLGQINPLQTPPQPIFLRSILIPFSHLRLGPSSGLFPSGFSTKTLCNFLSYLMRATCTVHLILLGLF